MRPTHPTHPRHPRHPRHPKHPTCATTTSSESRDRRPAVRRRHQRRRRAACALRRRAPRAARPGRGADDLRASRLHLVEERAARRQGDGARHSGAPLPGRRRARPDRVREVVGEGVHAAAFAPRRARLARRRGADQPGADRLHPRARSRLRLLHLLQLPLSPLVPRLPRGAGEGDPRADRRARRRARPGPLSADVPRRPRVHVQLVRRARADPGRLEQRIGAGRGRRRRLGDSRALERRALPAEVRHARSVRDLRRPHRREQGLRRAVRFLRALQRDARRRHAPGADRHARTPDPEAPAHSPSRLPRGPGQVRRDGGGRAADHAVVSREPVDGGARSVGDGQAGARQREMRRAAGPVPAQQRRPVLRELPRSSPRRCARSIRRRPCRRRSAATAARSSSGTTRGR